MATPTKTRNSIEQELEECGYLDITRIPDLDAGIQACGLCDTDTYHIAYAALDAGEEKVHIAVCGKCHDYSWDYAAYPSQPRLMLEAAKAANYLDSLGAHTALYFSGGRLCAGTRIAEPKAQRVSVDLALAGLDGC